MPALLTIMDAFASGARIRQLTLVCSSDTKAYADRILDALTALPQCKPGLAETVVVDAYDHRAVAARLAEIAKPPVRIDLTGGTKPMSIGAYEAASDMGQQWTYIVTERGEVLDPLESDGRRAIDPRVVNAMSVQLVIRAHGQRANTERPQVEFVEHARQIAACVADPKGRSQLHSVLGGEARVAEMFRPLQLLLNWGWAHLEGGVARRTPACPWTTAGDWLELYVAGEVREIDGCRDIVVSADGGVERNGDLIAPNEHDVMFLHRGSLVIIECKGGVFFKELFDERYSLKQIWGGRYARAGFVLLSENSNRTHASSALARIAERGMFGIAGDQLLRLRERLAEYLERTSAQP